jgi:energy-coupling factor transporter ATP-binding protein EcfA2
MEQDKGSEALVQLLMIAAAAVFLPAVILIATARKYGSIFGMRKPKTLLSVGFTLLTLAFLGAKYLQAHKPPEKAQRLAGLAGLLWVVSGGLVIASYPLWSSTINIKERLKNTQIKKPKAPKLQPSKPLSAFLGTSMIDADHYYMTQAERCMHTVIVGSTGSGKTTVLKSMLQNDAEQKNPALIIDPKGNSRTVQEMIDLLVDHGRNPEDFRLFSIINPKNSLRYNPLRNGTAIQIKDRLMGSLEWSEPYYKNQANQFLGNFIELLYGLNEEITFKKLLRGLTDKEYADEIRTLIKKRDPNPTTSPLAIKLQACLSQSRDDLNGLISQLSDLTNEEFGYLFEPDKPENTIDILSGIKNSNVIYLQLNTMAYEVTARIIGKLALQDLKSLASQIHGGNIEAPRRFFPIYIDEATSFLDLNYIDFLKMSRDVLFANHLFFQGLAGLDAISKEFRKEIQQNCLTKIILRTDDPDEAEFWASVAGTVDSLEHSSQLNTFAGIQYKTGAGNLRSTKEMRVEHDVFKMLQIGQAVVIKKAPYKHDLLDLYLPIRKCTA